MCKSDIVYKHISYKAFILYYIDLSSLPLDLWGSRNKLNFYTLLTKFLQNQTHAPPQKSPFIIFFFLIISERDVFSFVYFLWTSSFLLSLFINKVKDTRVSNVLFLCLTVDLFLLIIGGRFGIRKWKSMVLCFSFLDSIFVCWAWSILKMGSNSTSSSLSLPSPGSATDTAWSWIFRQSNFKCKWASRNRTSFLTIQVVDNIWVSSMVLAQDSTWVWKNRKWQNSYNKECKIKNTW